MNEEASATFLRFIAIAWAPRPNLIFIARTLHLLRTRAFRAASSSGSDGFLTVAGPHCLVGTPLTSAIIKSCSWFCKNCRYNFLFFKCLSAMSTSLSASVMDSFKVSLSAVMTVTWCSLFTATPHWPLTRPSHPAAGQLPRSSPHLATDLHLLFYKYVYGFPDYQNIKTKIKDLLYLCQKCSVIQTGFRQQHFTGKLWLNARHPKYFSFGFFYSD